MYWHTTTAVYLNMLKKEKEWVTVGKLTVEIGLCYSTLFITFFSLLTWSLYFWFFRVFSLYFHSKLLIRNL